jgi:hypothetical protein
MTILSNWSNISPRLFDAIVFVEKEDTHMHIINWDNGISCLRSSGTWVERRIDDNI